MRVDFEDVTVALGGKDVVHGASLAVESGMVVGLVGPNGSGKSSLLRTLYRGVKPRGGSVRLDGRDVRLLSGRQVARSVAVMLQDPPTDFDLSVEETVMLGRAPHHASFGRDTPEDVEVVTDAMRRGLSGGQRARVAIARALLRDPRVLVLDEPTASLDPDADAAIMELINDSSSRATLLIAHRPATIAAADRQIVLGT